MRNRFDRVGALCFAGAWLSGAACGDEVDWVARRVSSADAGELLCDGQTEQRTELPTDLDSQWREQAGWPLCVCGSGTLGGELEVAVNSPVFFAEDLRFQRRVAVGGDLGVGGVLAGGSTSLEVGGSLWVGGAVEASGTEAYIGGNAHVGGDVLLGLLQVAGGLTVTPDAEVNVAGGGSTVQRVAISEEPVSGGQPGCSCSVTQGAGVAELLQAEVPVRLAPDQTDWQLCDQQVLIPDSAQGDLRVRGAGLLVIRDRSRFEGDLELAAPPNAVLDVVVLGELHVAGTLRTVADGGQVRLFITEPGTLTLRGAGDQVAFTGQLIAPSTTLLVEAPTVWRGALQVQRLDLNAALTIVD